jgi:hypothetical protein
MRVFQLIFCLRTRKQGAGSRCGLGVRQERALSGEEEWRAKLHELFGVTLP